MTLSDIPLEKLGFDGAIALTVSLLVLLALDGTVRLIRGTLAIDQEVQDEMERG